MKPNLPNTVFEALSPEKLAMMTERALSYQQEPRRNTVLAFPSPVAQTAWWAGTSAVAASLFLAITLMPTPSQTAAAAGTDLNELLLYQTLSQ